MNIKNIRRLTLLIMTLSLVFLVFYGVKTQSDADWVNTVIGAFLANLWLAFSYFFKEENWKINEKTNENINTKS